MNIDIGKAFLDTTLMTIISTVLAYLVGLPLGVLLTVTDRNGLHPNRIINNIFGLIVNFLRSVPCLIITVILIPLNRAIFGKGTGEWYTMLIPLFFSSFAYVARIVDQSLKEVPQGSIEAVRSMGGSDKDIIFHVLLPEARSSLILGGAVTLVNVIGYTSFAYNLGAGGLISEIWSFYSRHTSDFLAQGTLYLLIFLVVVIVQVFQELGLYLSKRLDKRLKNNPDGISKFFHALKGKRTKREQKEKGAK